MEIIGITVIESNHSDATREATLVHCLRALYQGQGRVALGEDRELFGEVPGTHAQLVWVDFSVGDTMVQEDDGLRRNKVPSQPNRSTHFSGKGHL
jgi:hypothetical protein